MIKRAVLIILLAASAGRGPETVKIDVNQAKLAVKAFPHHRHQEMRQLQGKCTFCHHDAREDRKPKKCGTCHRLPKKKDPETGAAGYVKAFHKKCLACHKQQADKPLLAKCKTCHPKK